MFVVSRIAYYLAGVRFDQRALSGESRFSEWQLLDLNQLHHNFFQSIWNLQSQPPLFNVATAALIRLPSGLLGPVLVIGGLLLGLGTALSCYWLGLELRLPKWVAFCVALLVVLDPAAVLYENWFFYTFPTAFFVTFAALSLVRLLKTKQAWWGLGYFGAVAAVVLMNSTFQWPWLVVVVAPVLYLLRHHWRVVGAVAAVPILCVVFWYGKNAVLFHTTTTSSWTGMNLARITTGQATPSQLDALIRSGKITPISRIIPFDAPPSAYGKELSDHPRTGVAVLDDTKKSDGSINFNNVNFIAISNQYLHNDIRYIESYPGTYAESVGEAVDVFLMPSDQYFFVASNQAHISPYARAYNLVVNWQLQSAAPETVTLQAVSGHVPSALQVPWGVVLVYAISLLGVPWLAWGVRRDRALALTLGYMWVTTAYVFLLTNLLELGENNRFRVDLGPLPIVAAAVVVVAAVRHFRGRRGGETGSQVGLPVAGEPQSPRAPVVV